MIKWRRLHEHQHDRTHFAAMLQHVLQRAALPGILATLYMSITMPMDTPHIHVRTCGAWN